MGRTSLKNICRLVEANNHTTPVEDDFLADLKRSIELTDMKNRRKPSQTFKPSSMNCIRNMWYQVMGYDQDEAESNYSLVGICNSGSDIHERVQTYVSKMCENGIDCEYVDVGDYVLARNLADIEVVSKQGMETKLYHKRLNISFLCDGIIRYKGKYYILELKTESSYKWLARKGVDPKHYNQGISYSMALDIENVIFVYITRDVLDMKSFMFTPTTEQKQELEQKILTCTDYVKTQICPDKPENLPKGTCTYCAYKSRCN